MLKGFKDFIMQGNVIDLAVAVVIGTAFASIVDAFTSAIINPLIALLGGNSEIGFAVQLLDNNPETRMDFGLLLTAIINFLLIAAVIYFVLVGPMNKLKEAAAKRKGVDAPASDNDLLVEIRDLLAGRPLSHPSDPRNPSGES
ncbi:MULTISPECIES: large conductance mechanosensitive channel protein MscL [unclassified Dietzia]|uniref:large conductance mechanosensitive channel protein MscL n=1 Tax=unclassified Dietzia TaxID=2617939 RepID=UPI000D223FDD|nr:MULTISPECIES: large conductance mechanosensitive channel protein MscL [unclassified Dietzia]AVZ39954.1 large conductance mechanosensitive channel protein MscL [Dietzia sp. JS16-p6b]MBB1025481.1 large conductance mechanosensitive channel protein MscL [Dietzia sp. DQ12-76]MBB1027260.1 large conductance mechanosensitive channel protein MscL [Dietzia sp. DQ11-38-2]QGW25362.1 putative large-conductance mechanosensitive channel protein [Dietzia sp. DQ12-45-1b]